MLYSSFSFFDHVSHIVGSLDHGYLKQRLMIHIRSSLLKVLAVYNLIRMEQDGVSIPSFLKDFVVPLVRAGQQLQVLMKLLELYIHIPTIYNNCDDFLPCWRSFSSSSLSYSSPLTFNKSTIQAMVLARECYYQKMNEKLDSILAILEVRNQQVAPHVSVPFFFEEGGGCSNTPVSYMLEDDLIRSPTTDKRSSNVGIGSMGSDDSSTIDEFSYVEDICDSSECSFSNSSEEKVECEKQIMLPDQMNGQQRYFSALSFSHNTPIINSFQNPGQLEMSCHVDSDLCEIFDRSDFIGHFVKCHHEEMIYSHVNVPLESRKPNCSCVSNTPDADSLPGNDWSIGHLLKDYLNLDGKYKDEPGLNPLQYGPQANGRQLGVLREVIPYVNNIIYDDPYKVCMDKIPNGLRHEHGSSFPSFLKSSASVTGCKINNHGERHGEEDVGIKKVSSVNLHLDLKDHKLEDMLTITSGGSSWEKLLGCSRKPLNNAVTQSSSLSTMFEIPVDIIIDKCLLQEIVLQYKYVSRLTIKFLEEGFDLQEHLMALRRYHFMEVADWADLFILSLWHHKWCVTEADQRLSEVQALLELSVQRSSCEQDHNKHRLFVYMKGYGAMPLAASVIGVRSFDFLGLGYRVDWPLCIILTPDALKIYAEIFSFLIQVKLAIFSLTDIWCSLKALVHLINKNHDSELHQREVGHLNTLMKMRHQVNHFVSTLQQYVESQLSHVSWCKFLHSLQNKVKDMMDLESVHMEYLTNSLHICFLSDETWPVASIIESILQCALDFRSCLTEGVWDTEMDQQNSLSRFSRVNISQVNSIKQKFDKNLKELHLCYLKTPKHKKFGLSCFWGYLNYNEYYSDVGNEMRYPGF
ncbi:Gamma-tubulin complex component [Quillaja saponaria]|uniref:Gamma-tubulin complex component n=1 Tax=Quillaja saponaria TaxID=32244 RepID=A0AAD7LV00_QUISA|nr:Gamma-tubulin complex component [Quillaja saponaria]